MSIKITFERPCVEGKLQAANTIPRVHEAQENPQMALKSKCNSNELFSALMKNFLEFFFVFFYYDTWISVFSYCLSSSKVSS